MKRANKNSDEMKFSRINTFPMLTIEIVKNRKLPYS